MYILILVGLDPKLATFSSFAARASCPAVAAAARRPTTPRNSIVNEVMVGLGDGKSDITSGYVFVPHN